MLYGSHVIVRRITSQKIVQKCIKDTKNGEVFPLYDLPKSI